MTHQNQYLRRIGTRFQQYESEIQVAIAKSVEADVSARRLEADSGFAFYEEFDRIASELKASGITIAQWCRQLNIADVRTLPIRLRQTTTTCSGVSRRRNIPRRRLVLELTSDAEQGAGSIPRP